MSVGLEFSRSDACAKCGRRSPWGVEVRGVYDGVLYWECPACQHAWSRWPEGSPMHKKAVEMIDKRQSV